MSDVKDRIRAWAQSEAGARCIDDSSARMRERAGPEKMAKVWDELRWYAALQAAARECVSRRYSNRHDFIASLDDAWLEQPDKYNIFGDKL